MVSRGLRLYGALDILLALVYVWIAFSVAPSREVAFPASVSVVSALLLFAGIGLCARARWGRVVALVACWTLLVGCAAVIAALVYSSAYLRGVYGGFGRGAALVSLVFAALVVEVGGLLPLLELRFLGRPEVREALRS
jgi:hypothetical protein